MYIKKLKLFYLSLCLHLLLIIIQVSSFNLLVPTLQIFLCM